MAHGGARPVLKDNVGRSFSMATQLKKQKTETMPQLSLGSSSDLPSVKMEISEEAQRKALETQDTDSS